MATKETSPGIHSSWKKRNLRCCFRCKKWLPRFMFRKLPDGWYSRDGLNYSCRLCNLKEPTRYTKKAGKLFDLKVAYKLTILQRLKELFTK